MCRLDTFLSFSNNLQSLHIANLEVLEIRYIRGASDGDGASGSFPGLFHSIEHRQKVRTLTLATTLKEDEEVPVPFSVIDLTFRNLSDLTVRNCTDQICICQFPALQTLTVESQACEDGNSTDRLMDIGKVIVEDVLAFLWNGTHDLCTGEPFKLRLCKFGRVNDNEEVKQMMAEAAGRLVLEIYNNAKRVYLFESPYISDMNDLYPYRSGVTP